MTDKPNIEKSPKTGCYFCGHDFDSGQLQGHLLHCGSILEQCPRRCGAWIQRKHKDSHHRECPKVQEARDSLGSSSTFKMTPRMDEAVWRPPQTDVVAVIEKEFKNLSTRTNLEMQERRQILQELDYLRKQYAESENRNEQLLSTIIGLRRNMDDEATRKADFIIRMEGNVRDLYSRHQDLEQFREEATARLEAICKSILHEQNEREQLELVMNNQDKKNELIYEIESQVNVLQNILSHEQLSRQQQVAEIEEQLSEVRSRLADHRPVSRDLLEDHLQNMKLLHEEVDSRLRGASDLITKHQLLDLELKQAKSTIEEDRCVIQALHKDIRALSKSYARIRNEFHEYRNNLSFKQIGGTAENTSGHLIWRIDDYEVKMKDAVENDTILYSKLFRASIYGYTLQMELNLNGIGKWRGRHLTATVNVVPGDYDPLLEWPCDLTIDIVLRDQAIKRNEAMNIVKSLTIRKKSSSKKADYEEVYSLGQNGKTEDSSIKVPNGSLRSSITTLKRQYIFIPHTSLDKFDYIKNNAMFFEVVVTH